MKSFDAYLVPIALAVFAAGNGFILWEAKRGKEKAQAATTARNCLLWFLCVCVLAFAIANVFDGDSIFNIRKKSIPEPPTPTDVPASPEPSSYSDTEMPTEYVITSDPIETQEVQYTPENTVMIDTHGLPSSWFSEYTEYLTIDLFILDFDSSCDLIPYDDHISYITSGNHSDPSIDYNNIVIDSARFYSSTDSDLPEIVESNSVFLDDDVYFAVLCEYHFYNDIPYAKELSWGCELFDSDGKAIDIYLSSSSYDSHSGHFIVYLPKDFISGKYLLNYSVFTTVNDNRPPQYLTTYFLLNMD